MFRGPLIPYERQCRYAQEIGDFRLSSVQRSTRSIPGPLGHWMLHAVAMQFFGVIVCAWHAIITPDPD